MLEARAREALGSLRIEFVQEAKVGRYSVDFLLPTMRIALEVDGAYWHRIPEKDARKDAFLVKHGWRVLRIKESELSENSDCVSIILARLNEITG